MKVKFGDTIIFNADWVVKQSEKEFIAHEKHHGLTEGQLKEAYALCKEAVKPKETPGLKT